MKFWSSEFVKEVESVVHECVSIDDWLVFNITDGVIKFVECYNQWINKEQSQATCVCKTAPSHKTGHQNINDRDSSSDNDDNYCRHTSKTADTYIEEWNLMKSCQMTLKLPPGGGCVLSLIRHSLQDLELMRLL